MGGNRVRTILIVVITAVICGVLIYAAFGGSLGSTVRLFVRCPNVEKHASVDRSVAICNTGVLLSLIHI